MSRLISWVRPPIRPLTDSRSLRVWVARGSIEYSAVTQPSPEPLRQRGTPSVTLAAQSTRVRPNSTSTEPSAWSSQLRVMVTGRGWSALRPSQFVRAVCTRRGSLRGSGAGGLRQPCCPGEGACNGPVMRSELRSVRTGGVPSVVDLTDECADFVKQESDGLLHVFVPHATAGWPSSRRARERRRPARPARRAAPPDDRWRHRHGSAGTAATTCCRPSCRRTRARAGARGADAAGHLAAHLPGRHQHRQPRPARPVLLPRRLTSPHCPAVGGTRQDAGHERDRQRDRRGTRPPLPR